MKRATTLAGCSLLALLGCVSLRDDAHPPDDAALLDLAADASRVDGADVVSPDDARDASADALTDARTDTADDRAPDGAADAVAPPCGTTRCADGTLCVDDACYRPRFQSTGTEGAFAPTAHIALRGGVHPFTTVTVREGLTVTLAPGGDGTLVILATGDVVIAGTIDLSGAAGGDGVALDCPPMHTLGGGRGGDTASPIAAPRGVADTCGGGGRGGGGMPGAPTTTMAGCVRGGAQGGGAGGEYCGAQGSSAGAGGGGFAGGGGGAGVDDDRVVHVGGNGGGTAEEGAAMSNIPNVGIGAGFGTGEYAGGPGAGMSPGVCNGSIAIAGGRSAGSGGGGGSIGVTAARDLAVATTFRAGSGGGGGGALCLYAMPFTPTCPADTQARASTGGGGGGGGGALRIVSATRIVVSGSLLARGGDGGRGVDGHSGGGGGGSGGVVFLDAPEVRVTGTIDARGGRGGVSARIAGMLMCDTSGAYGGLGRIRIAARPARCSIAGATLQPPPVSAGCVPSTTGGAPGRVFFSTWPE